MAAKISVLAILVLIAGLLSLVWVKDIQCSPKRKGSSGSGGSYSGGGLAYSSGISNYNSGGWRNPSNGNRDTHYSGGGWNVPSNGNTGNRYSGGGWRNPTNGNPGNQKFDNLGTGSKTKSGGSAKNFVKKNWKKAAAFGAGAYIGYKLSEGVSKLFNPNLFNGHDFNTWDRNARIDGWVCRNDRDCNWLDQHLECEDNGFKLDDIKGAWPWKEELRGRCGCEDGYLFNQQNGSCYHSGAGSPSWFWLVGSAIFIGVVGCFCCIIKYCVLSPFNSL